MPDLLVRSFAPLLLALQPCFTQPSFSSFWALACAWILCSGRRSLTRIIQSAQLTRFKHYNSFHRFFIQARWNLDDLRHQVFQLLFHQGHLLQQFLNLGIAPQACGDLLFPLHGNGDLPYAPVPLADRQNPDRAVAFALAFLAETATWFIAVDHAT